MAATQSLLMFVVVSAETINKYETRSMNDSQIKCEGPSCSINCIGDKSCTSSYSLDAFVPFELHCSSQSTCTECNINCFGKYSCYATYIYVYKCANVNIIGTKSFALHEVTVVNDPILENEQYSASLHISNNATYLSADSNMKSNIMSYLTINNQNMANIQIDCFGNLNYSKNECNDLWINNNIHSTNISLHCHEDTDCSHLSLLANNGILAQFLFECDANSDCTEATIDCGKEYQSQCDVLTGSDTKQYCNCIHKMQPDETETSAFWTGTNYGIPMTILCGLLILCLIVVIIKMLRGQLKDKDYSNMMRYEVEDAKELEQRNKLKMWIKTKFSKHPYGQLTQNEDEIDDPVIRRRVELEKLSALTRSEQIDSDDEVEKIMDGLGGTGSETFGDI